MLNRHVFAFIAVAALALPTGQKAFAQDAGLIVGIGDYGTLAPPLQGVSHDIQSAEKISQALGLQTGQMRVIQDGRATKTAVMDAIREIVRQTKTDGQVFLYFSGHGTRQFDPTVGGCVEGLFTSDGQTIVKSELERALNPLRGKVNRLVVMFDACHSEGVSAFRATRSLGGQLSPKFAPKAESGPNDICAKPSNMKTRSLLGPAEHKLSLQENWVEITSARPDEVSFDDPLSGGLATQSVRDCMLRDAKDLDGSGQISLAEIEQCAQSKIRARLEPFPELLPHHVSVRGARNLLPAPSSQQLALNQQRDESRRQERLRLEREQAESTERLRNEEQARKDKEKAQRDEALQRLAEERARIEQTDAERDRLAKIQHEQIAIAQQAQLASLVAAQPSKLEKERPVVAAVATLRDIHEQRRRSNPILAKPTKSVLDIGKDDLELTIRSPKNGFLYILLLGSDQESFYLLYPNQLDSNNRVTKNKIIKLPAPSWRIRSAGPPGVNHVLIMVTDEKRDLDALSKIAKNSSETGNQFLITPTDLGFRSVLSATMLGANLKGKRGFSSSWIEITERETQ
jgi:hypothetical protein